MSKKLPKKAAFKYTPVQKLPKIAHIKKEWDLKGLYYKNERDPRIEADLQAAEAAYTAFAKRWKNKDFTANATILQRALTEYETLAGKPEISRPGRYFAFRSVLNTKDHVAEKSLALISKRLRTASDQILFFSLTLGKLPKKQQQTFLQEPRLSHFHYFLERLFLNATHDLTEPEERIIRLKNRPAQTMWIDAVEKIISNRTITFKKQTFSIPEAYENLDSYNLNDRKKLWALIREQLEQIGEFAEHEFNAIVSDGHNEAELRGYKKPYSPTALAYEDTEKSIENLVEAVSTKGFALSRRFYKLKASLHGVEKIDYMQKYDPLGREPEVNFDQAITICRDVFYGLKDEYGKIFDSMLTKGQIDVFPRAGKRGGAFMSSETGHPTHVFLNHTNTVRSLETLAHEMGHAIHSERSAHNSPFYDGHSITTAETASTLFENLLFDAIYSQAPESEKMSLLHDRVSRDISTIQRQIAFFNSELEIHQTIAREGALKNEELASILYKHLCSYLGKAVDVKPEDGYSYVYIPHLRYGFYVYTYAFGILMSTIMANNYKQDPRYIENIDAFLCSGSAATVADIFKSIGINTSQENTFLTALENHERDIKELERFAKKRT